MKKHAAFARVQVLLPLCLLLLNWSQSAAELSTAGRDFWLVWPEGGSNDFAEVIISSDETAAFTVTGDHVAETGLVAPGSFQRINIPLAQKAICNNEGCVDSQAINIKSTSNITVQFYAYGLAGSDLRMHETYIPLPTTALGREWYVLSYPRQSHAYIVDAGIPAFVNIDRTHRCHGLDPPNDDQASLDPYNVYGWDCLACTICEDEDASGTHITSSAKVQVIAGNDGGGIPNYNADWASNYDEAMLPVCSWSTEHHMVPLPQNDLFPNLEPADLVRVIASSQGANLVVEDTIQGTQNISLGPGEWTEFFLEQARITSDRPVMVVEFALSVNHKGIGGPMAMLIVPNQLFKSQYRFVSPGDGRVTSEHVAVVVPVDATHSLRIDGVPVSATFTPYISGTHEVSVVPVSTGEHVIECDQAFGAYILGYEERTAYGSPAGMLISEDCIEACTVIAGAHPVEGCEGTTVTLDGTPSVGYKCTGSLEYQWTENTAILSAFDSSPTFNYHLSTTSAVTLEVRCSSEPSCTDSVDVSLTVIPDPVPDDQGNTLFAVKDVATSSVKLDFPLAPAGEWRAFRDFGKLMLGGTGLAPDVTTPEFLDQHGVLTDGVSYFYQLKGLSPCSKTAGP